MLTSIRLLRRMLYSHHENVLSYEKEESLKGHVDSTPRTMKCQPDNFNPVERDPADGRFHWRLVRIWEHESSQMW
jgi:hypothetical protein